MHAFDILAEAKIRQWQKEKQEGTSNTAGNAEPVTREAFESMEKRLYHDIRANILRSYMATGKERAAMLEEAYNMQVQLASRLERSGYARISTMFADAIEALKAQAKAVAHDKDKLQSMLKNLE